MDYKKAQEDAEGFARDNLPQCCAELIEWSNTGILCDGKVRMLRGLVDFAGSSALAVAEGIVKRAAFEDVVKRSNVEVTGAEPLFGEASVSTAGLEVPK